MAQILATLRQASKKTATKLKPVRLVRGIRSLGRGVSRVPLGPVVVATRAAGSVGSSVPFLQGFTDALVTIMERAEAVKQNRKECKELARLAESVVVAVVDATGDVEEDELDEKTRLNLAELEWHMDGIAKTMTRLEGKAAWRRFWRKDKHSDALAEHKKQLKHALTMFQTKELVIGRLAQGRNHKQTITTMHRLQNQLSLFF